MSVTPLRLRRQQAARWFILRLVLLTALIGGIAYASWFAPWAKPARQVDIEASK